MTDPYRSLVRSIDHMTTQLRRVADAMTTPVVADALATDDDATTPATTCSAQHHGFPGDPRECIRAAHHTGKDHVDERGFHWSNAVANYPVADSTMKVGHWFPMNEQQAEGTSRARAAREDALRTDRRISPRVLINRVNQGATLTTDEAQLLASHVAAEICDANGGRIRAEQTEDLLRIAHRTCNRSEFERARAAQRAEQAEAAITRVRDLAQWLRSNYPALTAVRARLSDALGDAKQPTTERP